MDYACFADHGSCIWRYPGTVHPLMSVYIRLRRQALRGNYCLVVGFFEPQSLLHTVEALDPWNRPGDNFYFELQGLAPNRSMNLSPNENGDVLDFAPHPQVAMQWEKGVQLTCALGERHFSVFANPSCLGPQAI